jgi:hypothetical protein
LCYVLTVTDVFPNNSTVTGYQARTDSKLQIMTDSPWLSFPLPCKRYPNNYKNIRFYHSISCKVVQRESVSMYCYWDTR